MYRLCSGIHIQYNYQCCYLYSLYSLCGRDTEKYYLYCHIKYRMYRLRSRIHV